MLLSLRLPSSIHPPSSNNLRGALVTEMQQSRERSVGTAAAIEMTKILDLLG